MDNYKHGDYKVQCDFSGFMCHASETRVTWQGYRVRKDFWEPRHPQDFVRAVTDDPSAPDPRPKKTADYVTVSASEL